MSINPPTGLEQPQKYAGGSYLDEELAFAAEVRNAAIEGRPINTDGVHPVTIAAVHPSLLDSKGQAPKSKGDSLVEGDPTDTDLPGVDKDKSLDSVGVSDGTSMRGEDTRLKGGGNLVDSENAAHSVVAKEQAKKTEDKSKESDTP